MSQMVLNIRTERIHLSSDVVESCPTPFCCCKLSLWHAPNVSSSSPCVMQRGVLASTRGRHRAQKASAGSKRER